MVKIIPAILTNSILDLQEKLGKLNGLVDCIQIDIMDGKFVDNVSVSLQDLAQVKELKNFEVEAHLMVEKPEIYFSECQSLGVKKVFFHTESVTNSGATLEACKDFTFTTGVALSPETTIETIKPFINQINAVLLLSVSPGFQGQKFMPEILEKIKPLKELNPDIKIEIDGGINLSNIKQVAQSKPDYVAVGSGLFESSNIKERLQQLYGYSS